MKLKLKNIGKLRETEINIDGITVIAGKNNTGKSTVGKSLYCIFSSMYDVNNKIAKDRRGYIRREIERLFIKNSFAARPLLLIDNYNEFINDIINNIIENNFKKAEEDILLIFNQLQNRKRASIARKNERISEEVLNVFFNDIQNALDIPDEKFYINRLNTIIYQEFKGQIGNVNNKFDGIIDLSIKKDKFKININNETINCSKYMELYSDIVYIDNPFILGNIDDTELQDILNHRDNIIAKIKNNIQDDNMTANILLQDKVSSVMDKLDNIGVGKLIKIKEMYQTKFKYQSSLDKEPLELINISAGLKTFIILKTLILNGHIKEKGCIVLDEPEIHLHPEWQLVFAELIVLLQKTFNLHILLNTHSPYFLRAIQVYSAKHEIADICNYYLAENDLENNMAVIRNVNNDTNAIYQLLYSPFQQLDDEPYL